MTIQDIENNRTLIAAAEAPAKRQEGALSDDQIRDIWKRDMRCDPWVDSVSFARAILQAAALASQEGERVALWNRCREAEGQRDTFHAVVLTLRNEIAAALASQERAAPEGENLGIAEWWSEQAGKCERCDGTGCEECDPDWTPPEERAAPVAEGDRVGVTVTCATCSKSKQPLGRDAPPGMCLCTSHDCDGYYRDPLPDSLWPGETGERATSEPAGIGDSRKAHDPLTHAGTPTPSDSRESATAAGNVTKEEGAPDRPSLAPPAGSLTPPEGETYWMIERGQKWQQSPTLWLVEDLPLGAGPRWSERATEGMPFPTRQEAAAFAERVVGHLYEITEHVSIDPEDWASVRGVAPPEERAAPVAEGESELTTEEVLARYDEGAAKRMALAAQSEQAGPVAWRQEIGGRWCYFDGPLDPREVHDNGKATQALYAAPPAPVDSDVRKALENMVGAFDNAVRRMAFPDDDFRKEAIDSARAALAQPASPSTAEEK